MDWVSSVFSILLLLLRDSSNFKIRIQAAAALAVPETIKDYGKSYYDVVKSVVHVVESFKSDQITEPSNFKYWIALEKQASASIKFSRCISACLRYLEAVQWTEAEEEKLRELLARINIDDPKTSDIKYQFPFIIRSSQRKSSMAETDEPTTTPIVEEPSRAELLGSNNWEGLLHPLNLSLRRLILLSGDFCQCTNDSFNGDKFSKYAGSCRYSKESFFQFEAADDYQVASRSSAKEGLWNGM